ncbi:hypothetical protein JCM33374_g6110 [Metschnikowia sp. JCM 33374]|nr:hypothetical protein JCM33374_g6110 [Metschnikowia sp. JCM 33374]
MKYLPNTIATTCSSTTSRFSPSWRSFPSRFSSRIPESSERCLEYGRTTAARSKFGSRSWCHARKPATPSPSRSTNTRRCSRYTKEPTPKETVLGWFDCASKIDASTGLIHDFYSKGSDRAFPFPAIYLNVKYLNGDSIEFPQLTTYVGAALGKPGSVQKIGWKTVTTNTSYIFSPIPHSVGSNTISEKLALNKISSTSTAKENSVEFNHHQLSTVSREIQAVQSNIDAMLAAIASVSNTDADIDMLRNLSNSLLNKPTILSDLDALKHHFQAHNQDIIMIEYLTRAVKEQIELSVRLSAEAEKKIA